MKYQITAVIVNTGGTDMSGRKRILSLLLCIVMVLGTIPMEAAAADGMHYTDVKSTDWFYEGVKYVYDNGLMFGKNDTTFAPNDTTTRSMAVTVLYRLEGSPAISAVGTFSDVEAGTWYTAATEWAAANGVVSGYGNGRFGPSDIVTREQMAAILYRYAGLKGYDRTKRNDLSSFADASSVSGWAKEAMAWANAENLITGTSPAALSPTGNANRAQIATILMRFCKNIIKKGGTTVTLNNFSADETDFIANQSNTITFTVNVSGSKSEEIDLDGGNGDKVAAMHDDGLDGDVSANDGIYSYMLSTNADVGSAEYYASSGSIHSNQVTIYYFEQPTEASALENQNVQQNVLNIESSYTDANSFVPKSKAGDALSAVETYAQSLLSSGDAVYCESSDNGILIKLSTGLAVYYMPNTEGVDSIGSDVSMTVATFQPCLNMYSDLDTYLALPDKGAAEIGETFKNYKFSEEDNYDNSEVTLDSIKSFKADEIVLWHGHGGYTGKCRSMLLTGETLNWISCAADCIQNRVVMASNGRAMITAKFIEKYCGKLDDSFFYLAACESGKDSTLADAFLGKGAAAVIANTETIYTEYNLLMEYEITHELHEINSATGNYYSLNEALSEAETKYGASDAVWYKSSDPTKEASSPMIFGGKDAENFRLSDISDSSEKSELPYEDIKTSDSFYNAVKYVYLKGIMAGITSTKFNPYDNNSRCQFAVYLYRMEGAPDVAYTAKFPDVADGQFYTKPVLWANGAGIMDGYADGNFEPNTGITREQAVTAMYKYAKYKEYDVSGSTELTSFSDADQMSAASADAAKWAVSIGLITGDQGKLNPQGILNRAQAATCIMQFMTHYSD